MAELKTTKSAPRKRTTMAKAQPIQTDRIAQRAYELFLMRGAQHGHDLEDWLAAEQELRGR